MVEIKEDSLVKTQSKETKHGFLKIVNSEDYDKWKQSKEKIIFAPIAFCAGVTVLLFAGKKLQFGQLIANPLKKQSALQTTKNRWDFLVKHSILFGTLAVAAGAYFKKQFNKYMIFKQYQKQVNFYMRWKIQNQIIDFINQQKQLTNEEKLKLAAKI